MVVVSAVTGSINVQSLSLEEVEREVYVSALLKRHLVSVKWKIIPPQLAEEAGGPCKNEGFGLVCLQNQM